MANILQNLILSAQEYKTILTTSAGVPFPVFTAKKIGWSVDRESEVMHAVGQTEPIGIKRNNAKYAGTLDLQAGELSNFLRLAGVNESTQLEDCTIAVTSLNALGFQRVFSGVNINAESLDINSKDKETVVSLKWEANTLTSV